MLTIIKFEYKKIMEKRVNRIAALSGWVLIVVTALCWNLQFNYYDEKSGEYVYGAEAIRLEQERNKEIGDVLTEELVTGIVRDVQEQAAKVEMVDWEDDIYPILRPQMDVAAVILKNYIETNEYWEWESILDIQTQNGIGFYEQRMNKIRNCLNMDYSYGNFSEAEKKYWLNKAEGITTPFAWGNKRAALHMWDIIGVSFFLLLVIIICMAPVFASEYETKADSLLLTTKYGKTRLIGAKIAAAAVFCVVYLTICIGTAAAIIAAFCGWEGYGLPVQLWNTSIPYDWTAGKACLINFLLVLFVAEALTLFTLMLSARVKSSFVVLIIGVTVLLGPGFIPFSRTSRLWNHIMYLFPVRVLNLQDVLGMFNSYPFGSLIISYLGMIVIVYTLLIVFSFLGIGGGFARHQAGS